MRLHASWLCLVLTLALASISCSNLMLDPKLTKQLSEMTYPQQAKFAGDLDILVVSDNETLQLINRTPRNYGPMYLWLNQQWVGAIDKIDIGTENRYQLPRFINQYGESYPCGTFLHPDRAFPVTLAELYDPAANVRYRLVARVTGL